MRDTEVGHRRPSPYPRPVTHTTTPPPKRTSPKRRRLAMGASALAITAAVTMSYMSSSTAYAEGDEHTVTFNGSCGLLGAGITQKSTPDKTSMDVERDTEVTFVNNIGADGTLLVGQQSIDLKKGESYSLSLAKSSEAMLAPDCAIHRPEKAEKATITVTAPPPEKPAVEDPDPAPPATDPGTPVTGPDPVDAPDGGEPPVGTDNPAVDGTTPDGAATDDPAADGTAPDPTDREPANDPAEGENAIVADNDTPSSDDVEAVDASTVQQGSSGVLAVLATVCLVGVGVAAARTMTSGRAARA